MWGGPVDNPSYGEDPVQLFPYHIRLRGPPSPTTAAVDRGMWLSKPFYTGDNDGGVIMATWPELQVCKIHRTAPPAPPPLPRSTSPHHSAGCVPPPFLAV